MLPIDATFKFILFSIVYNVTGFFFLIENTDN